LAVTPQEVKAGWRRPEGGKRPRDYKGKKRRVHIKYRPEKKTPIKEKRGEKKKKRAKLSYKARYSSPSGEKGSIPPKLGRRPDCVLRGPKKGKKMDPISLPIRKRGGRKNKPGKDLDLPWERGKSFPCPERGEKRDLKQHNKRGIRIITERPLKWPYRIRKGKKGDKVGKLGGISRKKREDAPF